METQKTKKTTKTKNPWLVRAVSIAAAFAALALGGLGYFVYDANFAIASTVSLDVNPSIELQVNQKEKVLKVLALNDDGKKVIGDMDFSGSTLDVTVNALIGSMLRNGYISEIANSILISVDSDDKVKGDALTQRLAGEVDALLRNDAFGGAVLSQTVSKDDALKKRAEQYGITPGKAQLIDGIVAANPLYTFENLVPLSINELNLLKDSKPDAVASTGQASDKAYIGTQKATDAALAHAGVAATAVTGLECKLDAEGGQMVYEVEFFHAGMEYDYHIAALTGHVIAAEKEWDDDHNGAPSAPNAPNAPGTPDMSGTIGTDKATAAALAHAGIAQKDAQRIRAELDTEDNRQVYEVEFYCGGYEYDYAVDASNGAILSFHKEKDDDAHRATHPPAATPGATNAPGATNTPAATPGTTNPPALDKDIGSDKAKSIALAHAGLSGADVHGLAAERDNEDGVWIYEVEFTAAGYEYDYEISAADGSILRSHKEVDD